MNRLSFFILGVLVGVTETQIDVLKSGKREFFHNRTPLQSSAGVSSETALVCGFFMSSSLICTRLSALRSQRGRRAKLDLNERSNQENELFLRHHIDVFFVFCL